MGDQPTVENLKRGLIISVCLVTAICGIWAIFSKPDQRFLPITVFASLVTIVVVLKYISQFILNIRIDPLERILYSEYITIKGETGTNRINIREAKYSYKLRVTKGYQGYVLTIKDVGSKLQIRETKSATNKDQKNRFLKSQLDQMNQLILQIRDEP